MSMWLQVNASFELHDLYRIQIRKLELPATYEDLLWSVICISLFLGLVYESVYSLVCYMSQCIPWSAICVSLFTGLLYEPVYSLVAIWVSLFLGPLYESVYSLVCYMYQFIHWSAIWVSVFLGCYMSQFIPSSAMRVYSLVSYMSQFLGLLYEPDYSLSAV